MKAIAARLDRIAVAIQSRPQEPPPSAEDAEVAALMKKLVAGLEQPIPPALWHACVETLDRYMEHGTPLAMPIEVASYYRALEQFKSPSHECIQCGYALPATFTQCPLCRGKVAWQAWSMAHPK